MRQKLSAPNPIFIVALTLISVGLIVGVTQFSSPQKTETKQSPSLVDQTATRAELKKIDSQLSALPDQQANILERKKLLEKAIHLSSELTGPTSDATLAYSTKLTDFLKLNGKFKEAMHANDEACAAYMTASAGKPSLGFEQTLLNQGIFLLYEHRFIQADAAFDQCLMMASALKSAEQVDEVSSWLEVAHRQSLDEIDLLKIAEPLKNWQGSKEKNPLRKAWLNKAIDLSGKLKGPASDETLGYLIQLGDYVKTVDGNAAEAKAIYADAATRYSKAFGAKKSPMLEKIQQRQ